MTTDEEILEDAARRIVQVVEGTKAEGTAGYFIRKVPMDMNYQRDWYAIAAAHALSTAGWTIIPPHSQGVTDTVKEGEK